MHWLATAGRDLFSKSLPRMNRIIKSKSTTYTGYYYRAEKCDVTLPC